MRDSRLPRVCLPPIWRELRLPLDTWMRQAPRTAMPLPAGRGQPVVLIPGFLLGDGSLASLAATLRTAGFDAWPAGIARNVDCSEAHLARLTTVVQCLADETGERVALVGHSRGGLFARALACRRPDLVSGAVTLGSPLRDQLAVHPLLWFQVVTLATLGSLGLPRLLRHACAGGPCCEPFRRDVRDPLPAGAGFVSVYSRRDGIVDWRACVDQAGRNIEVDATHCGMPTDPTTIRALAGALAGFAAEERPARPVPGARLAA